jgi:glycosyltransferase involved in cell wall biosynthesis
MVAGMDHSRGDVIIPLDADLQNDPNSVPALMAKIDEGYDVVSGWRAARQDTFISRKLPSQIANRLISSVSGVHLHDYGCTLKAYRREVLDPGQPVRRDAPLHPDLRLVGGGQGHRGPGQPPRPQVRHLQVRHHAGPSRSCWTCWW